MVFSGPAGVGKTTITREVERRVGGVFSVSMTTRDKTHQDVAGRDYHFVDENAFRQTRDGGGLLEWARVFDRYYGTPKQPIDDWLAQGRVVILDVDVRGAIQVHEKMPGMLGLFILPPSEDELLRRLRARKREDEERIQRRFAEAKREIRQARDCGVYDHFIVNDDLAQAIEQAVNAVNNRRHAESSMMNHER